MVNKEVVIETIKKMRDAGVDIEAIKNTLADTGLTEAEAVDCMREAGLTEMVSKPEEPESKQNLHEKIAEKTAEKVKQHLNEHKEELALRQETTHAALAEHDEKLSDLHDRVSSLDEKVHTLALSPQNGELISKMIALNKRVSALEKQTSEIKAISSANHDVLKKILEVNRKILTRLSGK